VRARLASEAFYQRPGRLKLPLTVSPPPATTTCKPQGGNGVDLEESRSPCPHLQATVKLTV
jgi:hypothetical protein